MTIMVSSPQATHQTGWSDAAVKRAPLTKEALEQLHSQIAADCADCACGHGLEQYLEALPHIVGYKGAYQTPEQCADNMCLTLARHLHKMGIIKNP